MASAYKGQKAKGGKPVTGSSAVEAAAAKNAQGVAVFKADPTLFTVFTVTEDVGVEKGPRPEYILKGVFEGMDKTVSVFVPAVFTKNSKLVLREMGMAGRRLAVSAKTTAVERTRWQGHLKGGCMSTGTVLETNYIVSALL